MKKVAVVLVNYHDYAKRFLNDCRQSLLRQDYDKELIDFYVVDNDSSEETFNYLKKEFPEAKILRRKDGNYSAANNLGFQEAIANGCQYLITANMDTQMDENWLKELVRALEQNPEVAVAQSKILLYKKSDRINSLGNNINYLGFGYTDGYFDKNREINGYPNIKGYASGCSFIVKSEVFKMIGGWNEEYYMYHDDVEFSLKIKTAGYKIVLAPKSVMFHKYEFSRSMKMFYFMEKNRYLTLLIFASKKYLSLIFLPLFAIELGMLFKSFFDKSLKARLKVYMYFLKPQTWIKIKKERRKIKEYRKVSFSQLSKDFTSKIEFQEIDSPLMKIFVNPFMKFFWFFIKKLV
ncbi:MAG: glycosyltransferase family 2 protein [Patescibacteria group bacterium]|jgi:GT2 family glycosyltransferase|nr:glycosyltransferase family 2 protein [Patescibacteria group bacterium]